MKNQLSNISLSAQFQAAQQKHTIDSLSRSDFEGLKEICKSLIDQNMALRDMYLELAKRSL